jgi:hypothetical protein
LTIYLRCGEEVSGTLSVNIVLPDGTQEMTKCFDINKNCKDSEIKFDGYQGEKNLHFTFESNRGEKNVVDSIDGRDIQIDQDGFYMILKITNTPPFIANGSI